MVAIPHVVVSIADKGSMYEPGHRLFRRSRQYFHSLSGDAGRLPDGVPGSRPKSGVGRNRKNHIASTLYCI